jgi:hypothetical protein
MSLVLDPPASPEQAQTQRDELAKALYGVLVGIGVLSKDAAITGPHLLMAAEDVMRENGITESETTTYGAGR